MEYERLEKIAKLIRHKASTGREKITEEEAISMLSTPIQFRVHKDFDFLLEVGGRRWLITETPERCELEIWRISESGEVFLSSDPFLRIAEEALCEW